MQVATPNLQAGDRLDWPYVVVVVLNWNGLADTAECLRSLEQATYPNFHTLVVDNGSDGDDADVIEKTFGSFSSVIRNPSNVGYARGNNVGIERALDDGAEYILVLNNDTVVAPDFLEALVERGGGMPEAGILGPKTYYMEPPDVLWSTGGKINWYLYHGLRGIRQRDRGQYDSVFDCDFLPGSCLLIKRAVTEAIGHLPTEYFLQGEDVDYCTAARRAGFRCVYVPQSKIWHKVSASLHRGSTGRSAAVQRGFRNRIYFRRKYLSTLQFALFALVFLACVLPAHAGYHLIRTRSVILPRSMIKGTFEGFVWSLRRPPPKPSAHRLKRDDHNSVSRQH